MSSLWVPVKSSCVRVHVGLKMPVENNNCSSLQPCGMKLNTLGHGPPPVCTERAELVGKAHRLKPEQGPAYQVTTLVVAWISVVVTLALGILAVVFSASEQSTAAFAFGLDALLDTLSSLVVVWRFMGRSGSLYSARREKWACTVIGILFIVAFITVTIRSSVSIAWVVVPEDNAFLWRLSLANGTICAILSVAKFYLGWKLESISVITDGFNSVIGSILAFSTAISILIFTHNPSVWYLDAVCGIVCGTMLFVYGVWVIYSTRRGL